MLDVNDPARLHSTGNNTVRIAQLNDDARRHLNCNVVATPGFRAQSPHTRRALLEQLVTFDKFDGDNDPHGEHDFGKLTATTSRRSGKLIITIWRFQPRPPILPTRP